jgi:hypothetical protein
VHTIDLKRQVKEKGNEMLCGKERAYIIYAALQRYDRKIILKCILKE